MKKQHYITRRDILTMVNEIHEDLVQLFDCEACSLYFPKDKEITSPKYISEEQTLLLPLSFKNSDEILGVFLLRKPNEENVKNLLPSIENFIFMAMEKLYLKKSSLYDPNTDLFTQHTLITNLSQKIHDIRDSFTKLADSNPNPFLSSGAGGLVYFKLAGLKDYAKKYGYLFAEQCLQVISSKILEQLPHDIILARVNEFDCALILTEENCDGRMELNDFIYTLCQNLTSTSFTPPEVALSHSKRVNLNVNAGYILFPQDYDNILASRESVEVAYSLLAQAAFTANRAYEQKKMFLPFAHLIQEGGNITKILPHNKILINLGRNVGLREFMRFAVYSSKPNPLDLYSDTNEFIDNQNFYKGDLTLVEIFDEFSLAESSHTYDPTYPFAENDNLVKLPDDFIPTLQEQAEAQKDSLTRLYKYTDFLSIFAEKRQKVQKFSLALIQVDTNLQQPQIPINNILAETMNLLQHSFIAKHKLEKHEQDMIFSRYGENNILCFIPLTEELDEHSSLTAYQELSTELNSHLQRKVSIGIAMHPFLHYKSSEALENCKKALECAKLLEAPHVTYCDSTSLTIAADKLATQGLVFEALQEYQYAILVDPNNALAHNSLGVVLVGLKRYSEAQKTFLKALELIPDDISIHYNLGGIAEKLGEVSDAKRYYSNCLSAEEYSYFAMVRLGLIAESEQDYPLAINYYTKAIELEKRDASPYRQLAKIALQENNVALAREHLYTALRYTDNDPHSLILLAKIYLDSNENPHVITALLAPIMTQKQTNVEAWQIYAKALKAQGKDYEAASAEMKVQSLNNIS